MSKKNDFRNSEIERLYKEGYSITEIVNQVNISYDTILRMLKKKGIFKKLPSPGVKEVKKEIVEFFHQSNSVNQIAYNTNVPATMVNKILQENNLVKKEFYYAGKIFTSQSEMKNYRIQLRHQVFILSVSGKSKTEIATQLNISIKSVARFLKDEME